MLCNHFEAFGSIFYVAVHIGFPNISHNIEFYALAAWMYLGNPCNPVDFNINSTKKV